MVMNLILVCMVCQCNVYVIPESIRRKDLGYKGYEFITIANFVALLLLPCLLDFNLVSLSVSRADRAVVLAARRVTGPYGLRA